MSTEERKLSDRLDKVNRFRLRCTLIPTEYKMSYDCGGNLVLYGRDKSGEWSVWDETGAWCDEEFDDIDQYLQ